MTEVEQQLKEVKGLGDATADKLKEAGISDLETLAVVPAREIVTLTGLTEEKASALSQGARLLLDITFHTAQEYYNKRKQVGFITTGTKTLDELLDGGIETQSATEFCGEFGVGKTQLAHQLCITVQLPKKEGGINGNALYIDTEGTFRPERLRSIAERFGRDPNEALERVIFARAYNSDHQMLLLDEASKFVEEKNIKLIIIDSIISHFRAEYPGRENLALRQQRLNRHIHQCLRLSGVYNLAVIVTNQALADPAMFFGNPQKPTGGNVLAHGIQYRLWLRRSKEAKRIMRIFDSPRHPEAEALFRITEQGIADIEEEENP